MCAKWRCFYKGQSEIMHVSYRVKGKAGENKESLEKSRLWSGKMEEAWCVGKNCRCWFTLKADTRCWGNSSGQAASLIKKE